ncbi:TlpA family protein disulfide reductase [Pseudomaricurvus alcaniphilus]|uniref:TlpA family protein disulfide reductase n=1 Tax=Pseudomaricurvus alcaniphilus TaxID=1166482 RepID=UPI0014096B6C|nr:TlpA disulfide reductase family protein [Pseudomaricurvus alcaniphilus]NHN37778.1 TlpA family protein disulfide reductase [Pseudomaricurvus alcaniphilus]
MRKQSLLILVGLLLSPWLLANNLSGAAPDFTLKSTQGDNLRLEEERGNVVLLNFWASWCGPCRQEMPKLDELHQRYQAAGFKVLGVNVETDSDAALAMLKKLPVSFPVLFDSDSAASKLYDVDAMPTTVLIDRDGQLRYLHRGYKPGYEELYREQIKELIRE